MTQRLNLLCLLFTTLAASASDANAARLVTASITLDGKTILEGTAGDNGYANSNTVWTYLKVINFRPPNVAKTRYRLPETSEVILRGKKVAVKIQFGGRIEAKKITLKRIVDKKGRHRWRLTPEFVDATRKKKTAWTKSGEVPTKACPDRVEGGS